MESFGNTSTRLRLFIVAVVVLLHLSGYPTHLLSEPIRGGVDRWISIDRNSESQKTDLGLREQLVFKVESFDFLRGLIVEIVSPPAVLQFRESFMVNLFSRLSPPPSSETIQYQAQKQFSTPFPRNRRTFIDLPFASRSSWDRSSPGSHLVSSDIGPDAFPLLLIIDPVMKGIPTNVSSSRFEIVITPVLAQQGALKIELPEDTSWEELDLFVDQRKVPEVDEKILLDTGVHDIEIKSEEFQTFRQKVGIEQARISLLRPSFEPAESFLRIEAPQGAKVFINGELVEDLDSKIEISPGEHMVLYRIGDYSASKKIQIQGGKDYNVSLFFDILVDEN